MPPSSQGSDPEPPNPEQAQVIRDHLQQVLASRAFAGSKRAQDFLHLLVDHTLAGRFESLRERMIGAEMFGRPVDYDTANDAVVRVKASEIRRRLSQYYGELTNPPVVRIKLPVGGYVPKFIWSPAKALFAVAGASSMETADDAADHETRFPGLDSDLAPATTRPRRFVRPAFLGAALAGLLALLAIGFLAWPKWRFNFPGHSVRTIAILPLLNLSGDPNQEYFADGMTEELITELGQVASLRVISRTSAMTYKNTKKSLPQIADELHVSYIVEGSIGREKNHIRVTTQLIDTQSDQHLWAQTYDRDMTSILDLQSEVARTIADKVRSELTPEEKQRFNRVRSASPEAIDLYLKGTERVRADDHQGAADFFKQAIAKDPGYAPAHAALASAEGRLGEMGWIPYAEAFSEEQAEALKAIELDDSRPEPHLELGLADMNQNWDFASQQKEFTRALQLNPNSSAVHWANSTYLDRVGRVDDGLAEAQLAAQIDPVSSFSHANLAYAFYYARQYDAAIAEEQKGVAPHARQFLLGVLHAEKGHYDEAIRDFRELGDAPHALGHGGNALARAGRSAEALAMIAKLNDSVTQTGIGRYEIAVVYAGLGDKDKAFEWFEKAYRVRDKGVTYMLIDPPLDPLRSDPRFQDLVHRVGFPKQ